MELCTVKDIYRINSRGQYINNFEFLNASETFPNKEILGRNSVYRYRHKQYTGIYNYGKRLHVKINGVEKEIPYKVISINYFKLITDKMTDLIFNNEINVKTGDIERDKQIYKLCDRLGVFDSFRKAFKLSTIYGDVGLKAHKGGVSVFSPLHVFKVVDKDDVNNTKAFALYQFLTTKDNDKETIGYIRFEIHFKSKIYEVVKQYSGNILSGSIGYPVEYRYKGRVIPKDGLWYDTGIDDCELVQMACINQEADGVYGESVYTSIQDIVYALEQRVSVNQHLLDDSMMPFIIIGANSVVTEIDDEGNEELRVKLLDGKYLVDYDGSGSVKPIELGYNLTNSENMISMMQGILYELSEMGKTYLSGEYGGNISEETLNNTIKSAIDKGNRLITELYTIFKKILYCLCRLNSIKVNMEDITIVFNVGRTDDDMKIAEICEKSINSGMVSKRYLREKYLGFSVEQSDEEELQIEKEKNSMNNTQVFTPLQENKEVDKDKDIITEDGKNKEQ